jgi:hypothetical protein
MNIDRAHADLHARNRSIVEHLIVEQSTNGYLIVKQLTIAIAAEHLIVEQSTN